LKVRRRSQWKQNLKGWSKKIFLRELLKSLKRRLKLLSVRRKRPRPGKFLVPFLRHCLLGWRRSRKNLMSRPRFSRSANCWWVIILRTITR
jgi:hypothetical protein